MASTVRITIKYDDNSKSYTEDWGCADTHPNPEVLKDLEKTMLDRWEKMGNSWRSIQVSVKVVQT